MKERKKEREKERKKNLKKGMRKIGRERKERWIMDNSEKKGAKQCFKLIEKKRKKTQN